MIVKVEFKMCQMIGCSENLEMISKSEKVSFQMVMERNDAV